ncbi:MAG TPA: phosphatidate cytidylyltransferase [Caldisericia bacterium]|nr:phosphatidate cytidylyltransferase [Caldisericia bacterium]
MKNNMIQKFNSFQLQSRLWIALIGIPLLLGSTRLNLFAFLTFWTLVWVFMLLELAELIQVKNQKKYLFILCASLMYIFFIQASFTSWASWVLRVSWLIFPLSIWLIIKFPKKEHVLIYFAYLAYITFPLFFLFHIFQKLGSNSIVLILLGVWAVDTFSYFTGITFGKHPIAPKLSPKKTIEGTLGGIIGASLVFLVLLHYFKLPIYGLNPYLWSLLLMLSAFTGDLLESYLKRQFGKKDSGEILMGHGGMLDRFDSMLFFVFAYILVLLS